LQQVRRFVLAIVFNDFGQVAAGNGLRRLHGTFSGVTMLRVSGRASRTVASAATRPQ
jgi:hypothetical protein